MGSSGRREEPVIYTIGHGNLAVDRFIGLLEGAGVELVVDVRSVPYSRFAPRFNKKAIAGSLAAANIGYTYLGDLLGGRPLKDGKRAVVSYDEAIAGEAFREGMRKLSDLARSHRTAVLCAERDPDRCHRKHIIARALVSRGGRVVHILDDGTLFTEGSDGLFGAVR